MSDLVGNPEDRFSRYAAQLCFETICILFKLKGFIFIDHEPYSEKICFMYMASATKYQNINIEGTGSATIK